jgi:hypothetical protein
MSSAIKWSKEDESFSEPPHVDHEYIKELEWKLKALEEQTHVVQLKQSLVSYEGGRPSTKCTPIYCGASNVPIEDREDDRSLILL